MEFVEKWAVPFTSVVIIAIVVAIVVVSPRPVEAEPLALPVVVKEVRQALTGMDLYNEALEADYNP